MAVAALLLWLCTAAIGAYLLVTAIHAGNTGPGPEESVPVPAEQAAAARTGAAATASGAAPARHRCSRFPGEADAERPRPLRAGVPAAGQERTAARPEGPGRVRPPGAGADRHRVLARLRGQPRSAVRRDWPRHPARGDLRGRVVVHRQHPRRPPRHSGRGRGPGGSGRRAADRFPAGTKAARARRDADPAIRRPHRRPRLAARGVWGVSGKRRHRPPECFSHAPDSTAHHRTRSASGHRPALSGIFHDISASTLTDGPCRPPGPQSARRRSSPHLLHARRLRFTTCLFLVFLALLRRGEPAVRGGEQVAQVDASDLELRRVGDPQQQVGRRHRTWRQRPQARLAQAG